MVPRTAYPPTPHHSSLTATLHPKTAQSHLAAFLAQTPTKPHLHPDSLLSSTGISYSAHSGPSGGLALHHLRRIEAGLRGENLDIETEEELRKFSADEDDEKAGDDAMLDKSIARTERKRKRVDEIRDWAEETSSSAGGGVESFAVTPLHVPDAGDGVGDGEWMDQTEWEVKQRPLEGEVGEREGAPEVRQNVKLPEVVEHDEQGQRKHGLTKQEKEARKKAKKARRREERAG